MFKFWHKMVKKNRDLQAKEQKAKGKDNNEIKKALDDVTDFKLLKEKQELEYQDLIKKGPYSTEFMLNHDEITGYPQF